MTTQITYATRQALTSPEVRANAVLIYNHIPKCGGLSLTHRLRQCYPNACDVHQNLFDIRAVPRNMQFYHGHGVSGIEHYLAPEKNFFYITILRHPWSLAQSLIRFFQWLTPLDTHYQQDPNVLLLLQQPNILIHYLGNGDKHLAEENLLQNYAFFGLQEHFSASMDVLTQTIPELAHTENIAKNVSSKEAWQLHERTKELFLEKNADDIALYTKAKEVFLRRANIQEEKERPKHSTSTSLTSSNIEGSNLSTIHALKESIALDEDLPFMDAPQARFENWLHILLYSLQNDAEHLQFHNWLYKRITKRTSCLYFAYACAKKSQAPALKKILPLHGQLLFDLCNQCDPAHACRLTVECRFEIIHDSITHGFAKTHLNFNDKAYTWLCHIEKEQIWSIQAQECKKALKVHITSK